MPEIINNRYILHERLGKGGMGTVYRATDRLTNSDVALKRVPMVTAQDGELETEDIEEARLALTLEFRTMASLRHPNIVSVMDYGFDSYQQPFFTMKLLDDPITIQQAAQNVSFPQQIQLIIGMLQALAYLHRRGIIHRDLKPGNVLVTNALVTEEKQVVVLDFGLSVASAESMTNAKQAMVGTINYMAPEMFTEATATIQTDLWAAGVMIYRMFTNEYPFDTTNMATLLHSVLQDEPDMADVPPSVMRVLKRLLEKDPSQRYGSAEDVILALSQDTGHEIAVENAAIRESFLQASRFVGHRQELLTLQDALQSMTGHTPKGSAWLITGENGIGKSRLIDEISIRAKVQGVLVLRGQGSPGGSVPFVFWREPLRHLLLAVEITDKEAGVLRQIIPDIDVLLGRAIPDAPRSLHPHLISTIVSVLSRQKQPTLLIMEDLQWATESLIPFQILASIIQELPILLLGSFVRDEAPHIPYDIPDARLMTLQRLNDDEIEELSTSILGPSGQKPQVVNLIKRETEGNVFFILEVLRALAEEAGSLADIGTMTLPQSVLAGGIQHIVQRRLRRISDNDLAVLQIAAVIGRRVDLKILFAVGATRDLIIRSSDIESWLTVCANAAILEYIEGNWRFTHEKLREAILKGMDKTASRALYRSVASTTEILYPQNPAYIGTLAEYWHQTGDLDKEFAYTLQAGEQAFNTHAYQEAIMYTGRALALLWRAHVTDKPLLHARLEYLTGAAYRKQGKLTNARLHVQRSIGLYRKHERQAELILALNEMGHVEQDRGLFDEARKHYASALAVAQQAARPHEIADTLVYIGTLDHIVGRHDQAQQAYAESLKLYRSLDDADGASAALNAIGTLNYEAGLYDEAQHIFEERLALELDGGHPYGIAKALDDMGIINTLRGNYDTAMTYYREALALARRIGDREYIANILKSMGAALAEQGQQHAAHDYYDESLRLFRDVNHQPGVADVLVEMGDLALQQANLKTARGYYQAALDIYREMVLNAGMMQTLAKMGEVSRVMGDADAAIHYYNESLMMANDNGVPTVAVAALTGLANTHLQQQHYTECHHYLQAALRAASNNRDLIQVLMAFAHFYKATRKTERSAELLGFIASHPATPFRVITLEINPFYTALGALLPDHLISKALARGQNLGLEAILQDLHAELQP